MVEAFEARLSLDGLSIVRLARMIDGGPMAARSHPSRLLVPPYGNALVTIKSNRWVQVAILCLLYVVTGRLGHLLAIPPGLATPVWLPSGITLAAIVLFGSRLWPGVFLGAFLTCAFQIGAFDSVSNITSTSAIGALIAIAVTAEPLVVASLVRRLGIKGQFLSRARNVAILLLVAAPISCAFTATLASVAMATTGLIEWARFGETLATWMIGDVAGIYLITPALLVWSEGNWPKLSPGDRVAAVVSGGFLAVLCTVSLLEFPSFGTLPSLGFLPIPLLVFIAYRFDNRIAGLVGPAVAAVAIVATANGLGPFSDGPSNEGLLVLQLYVLVGVLTALLTRALTNERDAAEQAAQRLSADLAQVSKVTMMGEIAAGLAHEYHQPLAAITNYASASLMRLRAHEAAYREVRESLDAIADETQRAAEIVDRLTHFLQTREPLRTACDPNEIVADAVSLAEMAHFFPRVSIRYESAPGLPLVEVDGIQITQALLNLIVNSCEAIESGDIDDGVVQISASLIGAGKLRIDVEDNGPGMDDVSARACFDQFYSTKEKGLGVGLGISRSLAEAHGGRLYHVPTDGRGTKFCLELPLLG